MPLYIGTAIVLSVSSPGYGLGNQGTVFRSPAGTKDFSHLQSILPALVSSSVGTGGSFLEVTHLEIVPKLLVAARVLQFYGVQRGKFVFILHLNK